MRLLYLYIPFPELSQCRGTDPETDSEQSYNLNPNTLIPMLPVEITFAESPQLIVLMLDAARAFQPHVCFQMGSKPPLGIRASPIHNFELKPRCFIEFFYDSLDVRDGSQLLLTPSTGSIPMLQSHRIASCFSASVWNLHHAFSTAGYALKIFLNLRKAPLPSSASNSLFAI